MTTWIISDTHFGDRNLVGTELAEGKSTRPFATVSEMNECLADNWNDHIAAGDVVLHLGDVYTGTGWEMLARLNGQKHLILGNHDNPLDGNLAAAFTSIALWNVEVAEKIALTHVPIDLSRGRGLADRFDFNIHGHLHGRPAPTERHLCVSLEQTDYKPVGLEDLVARLRADEG
ncbi:metallophosphoesterase [Pseudooceanicola algae]|uniref:Calcineurin-like phosphoesterase domain-containing protein n=1 Tax=Pseudooceanicola algae TaxID=1537215 RepID=A0A418SLE7_9RHOB|nr:metallophosphoesterase [Pseudooceanicola algae]QPM90838.1 hypothetical protein PSAL_020800 [Pseudooceanicola algae]